MASGRGSDDGLVLERTHQEDKDHVSITQEDHRLHY